ncbi:hypothetical protein KC343_g19600, partial [Hortaea werneckii]
MLFGHLAFVVFAATLAVAVDPSLKLKTFVDVMDLSSEFDPVKAAYWTNLPHHRRPDVTIPNVQEAGGLVAHDHGFALLGNEAMDSSINNAPPSGTPVPAIYRYVYGEQQWRTWLGGPDVHPDAGLAMSPDLNGDLVWSAEAELYGAYFVVTDYTGDAEGHYGDSI